MADPFETFIAGLEAPATHHFTIVPSNTVDMAIRPRAIYCQVAGAIVIRDEAGTELPYAMTVGQTLPFRGVRIMATGTTGTFYGLY